MTNLPLRTALLTLLAMLAFAANSVLCRQALEEGAIDAASFTSLRIISGAVLLYLIAFLRQQPAKRSDGNLKSAVFLFTYMVFFSFAYLSLGAGTGALVLFGAVQLTMFAAALKAGEAFSAVSWVGLGVAISGLVYLISPGLNAPDLVGALLMAVAGIAWGLYSLAGKGTTRPLQSTAMNFLYSIPLVLPVSLFFRDDLYVSQSGILLAIASGALASGCGYAIWYAALPHLRTTHAATVQLSVPAIAALGGVVFLSEDVTTRLIIASLATLGGVALVLSQRAKKAA